MSNEPTRYFGAALVAGWIGIAPRSLPIYLKRYAGTDNPCPAPDVVVVIGDDKEVHGWLPTREAEWREWNARRTGRGVGGGAKPVELSRTTATVGGRGEVALPDGRTVNVGADRAGRTVSIVERAATWRLLLGEQEIRVVRKRGSGHGDQAEPEAEAEPGPEPTPKRTPKRTSKRRGGSGQKQQVREVPPVIFSGPVAR